MNHQRDPFKSVVKLTILYYGFHTLFVWPVRLVMTTQQPHTQRRSLSVNGCYPVVSFLRAYPVNNIEHFIT